MGNAWYCKKCEEGRKSKITVSGACAEKFINEETGEEYTPEERWRNRVHCLDDLHSSTHGLTIENFNKLADKVEEHCKVKQTAVCKHHELLTCLHHNPDCIIRCMREMEEFIDCIDTARINTIKQKMKQKQREEKRNELAQIFNTS